MERKAVSGSMLALLLISMLTLLTLAFNIQPIKAGQEPQLTLETDKDTYIIGEDVTIVLTNIGVETIWIMGYPAYQIYTYPKDEPVYPSIFLTLLWSLEPGENDTFVWNQHNSFTHTPVEPGMYVIRDNQGWGLSVYFDVAPTGDVNDDGVVDIFDLSIVGLAYGSFEGDPNYNPDADLNNDGLVDARDLAFVTYNYGKTAL